MSPSVDPSQPAVGRRRTTRVLDKNVRAVVGHRAEGQQARTHIERIVDRIAGFAGSMPFVYLHLVVFGGWLLVDMGWIPGVPPQDPAFAILGTIASVEAIFLAAFVLMTQKRMADAAETRAHLALQVGLLSEHEMTRVLRLVTAMSQQMGIQAASDPELQDLARDVAPEEVLKQIEIHTEAMERESLN